MKSETNTDNTAGSDCPAATCSALRELVFSRAVMGGNVSIRVTPDSGKTVGELTKSELEGIVSTLRQSGWSIFGQNDES